jgi:flavoprotein
VLVLPDYHGDEDVAPITANDDSDHDDEEWVNDVADDVVTTTTSTTMATRPSIYIFPTRNRHMIPSRRSTQVNLRQCKTCINEFRLLICRAFK